ncbi:DEAD/DEAH box helicase [Stigmatella sp. ncwal1]|uniref:DEAD/DEAH box helicase n=1 Tax=Stigmatella ashevillensis TaxID=2995309 RepID=A0ABT5DAE0_9BACT|nr:DEAD/DEAH box helicase [Stigmatella ashevillena]MDC0710019.1 DEAD/DEAH box helicase [Stigmatella ashevillena]
MRTPSDRYLPPAHETVGFAGPQARRVIVIAPTRAACETIELAMGLRFETYLEKHHGPRVRALARGEKGFGIVAGTGSGKTLAIRLIAEEIVGLGGEVPLRVGVINREREATADTPTWNVIIVTTGIARRWFQNGDILPRDTLLIDEIHQTSAELELCLALGKRVGCRFIWLSATVDPALYARYLNSANVLEVQAFDPAKVAKVVVERKEPLAFLDEAFLLGVEKERRGVGLFLPTRAAVEQAAAHVRAQSPRINAAYYHGGEPIRAIRPFLEGTEARPFFLAMTAAGQSALNVPGLDTVIIDDTRFANLVERGRNVLTRVHLGNNEILQMAGRVHGRVEGGRVFILSDRDIDFFSLRPTEPDFQLAGDSERVALTAAALGVRADALDLPVPLDRIAYRRALQQLQERNIVDEHGRLSPYGRAVEALPVERAWAELIVNAEDALLPFLAVCSAIESLHRMTREERNLEGVRVAGSDHLTAYNLYADAYREAGYIGEVHGLPRHLFQAEKMEQWAERRGVLVKAVEDAALAMASVYRSVGVSLPGRMPFAGERVHHRFAELLARFMPFELVIDEQTAWGDEARVSKTSMCGIRGAVAGPLRYFADRQGNTRAAIEGTQVPMGLLRKYARRSKPELAYSSEYRALIREWSLEYSGFELEHELEVLRAWGPELADSARRALADALARGETRHAAVRRNQQGIDQVREAWRRSGGSTAKLGVPELAALYEARLEGLSTMDEFLSRPLDLDLEAWVPPEVREALRALPGTVSIREREVPLSYEVEPGTAGAPRGVVRLHLPEKLARTLVEEELPMLDRPVRFMVSRGQRGTVRAETLLELQELLEMPWMQEEIESRHGHRPGKGGGRGGGRGPSRGGKPGGSRRPKR